MSRSFRALIAGLSVAALAIVPVPAASAIGSASLFGGSDNGGGVISPAPSTSPAPTTPTTNPQASQMAAEIFRLTNEYRAKNGVATLKYNNTLAGIAQRWSQTMADENRMYHNPNIASQYPKGWTVYAENVLQNWSTATAADLVQQWINSPPHRAAMLASIYTDIGIGYVARADGKTYATQNYARF